MPRSGAADAAGRRCSRTPASPARGQRRRRRGFPGDGVAGRPGRVPAWPGGEAGGREGSWVFARGEEWPLDADLVVVDESSMLDVELAAALVEACADGTRLLLVGDPAQLPSIGPGRVLADIIDSGAVPVTELTTLYRQRDGGTIAKLATAVRGGDLPAVDSPEREVVIVTARGSAEAAHRVVQLVTDSIPRALGIAAEEVQVVTPVHKGPAGTIELNRALKARLNPGPGAHRGFDPGDRVVAIANHADEGFANGEVGTVTSTDGEGLTVSFSGLPVTVPFKLLGDLRHGWALTVHRAQGSEWPAVVAVFPAEASGMLSRPLVYTALTRAQQHLSVVHGAGPALARAVRTIGERPRETRLAALLRHGSTRHGGPRAGSACVTRSCSPSLPDLSHDPRVLGGDVAEPRKSRARSETFPPSWLNFFTVASSPIMATTISPFSASGCWRITTQSPSMMPVLVMD